MSALEDALFRSAPMEKAVTLNPAGSSLPLQILFIIPYVPNLIRVRSYNLLRGLHANGHQVTLLTFYSSATELADARELTAYCAQVIPIQLSRWRSLWNCLVALPSKTPLQSVYCWHEEGAINLERLIRQGRFDVIHVEHLRGARYALKAHNYQTPPIPVVWDSVDSISYLFRQASEKSKGSFDRLITRLELGRTEQYESQLSQQFSRVLVTSANDKSALLALQDRFPVHLVDRTVDQAAHIQVLPNGVDLVYFAPASSTPRKNDTLITTGKMSYHANVTMVLNLVEEIMPRIWAHRPEINLIIAGKDPVREIIALADHPHITVTGTVSDLRPYLHQATIAVAPVPYGAGIQNKVLEAMACATPTITTPQAVSALSTEWGRHLLVADDPHSFAEMTLQLLADAPRRQQIGLAGRAYVEQNHHWERITERLAGIYREAILALQVTQEKK